MMVSRCSPGAVLVLLAVAVMMAPVQIASAAGASDRNLKKIVLDHTITYQGHEFYRQFVPLLGQKTGSIYFDSVTLKEHRSRRSGRTIVIEHREATLFRTTVYAGDQYIEAKARQAAAVVSAKLSRAQLEGLFSQGGDLAGDEL